MPVPKLGCEVAFVSGSAWSMDGYMPQDDKRIISVVKPGLQHCKREFRNTLARVNLAWNEMLFILTSNLVLSVFEVNWFCTAVV